MPRGKKNKQAAAKGPTSSKFKHPNTTNACTTSETATDDTSELKARLVNAQAKLNIINDRLASIQPVDLSLLINNENIAAITTTTNQAEKQIINIQNESKTQAIKADNINAISQDTVEKDENGSGGSAVEVEKSKKKRNRNRKKKLETPCTDSNAAAKMENVCEDDQDEQIISPQPELLADRPPKIAVELVSNVLITKSPKNDVKIDVKQDDKKESQELQKKNHKEKASISIDSCKHLNVSEEPTSVNDPKTSTDNEAEADGKIANINSKPKNDTNQPTNKKGKNKHNKKNESLKNAHEKKIIAETNESSNLSVQSPDSSEIQQEIKLIATSPNINVEFPLSVDPNEPFELENQNSEFAHSNKSVVLVKDTQTTEDAGEFKSVITPPARKHIELQKEVPEESDFVKDAPGPVPFGSTAAISDDNVSSPEPTGFNRRKNMTKKNRKGLKPSENIKQNPTKDSLAETLNASKIEKDRTKIKGNEINSPNEEISSSPKEAVPAANTIGLSATATLKSNALNTLAIDLISELNLSNIEPAAPTDIKQDNKTLECQQKDKLLNITEKVKEEIKIIQDNVDLSGAIQSPLLPLPKIVQEPKKIEPKIIEAIKLTDKKETESDKQTVDGTAKIWQILMEANQSTNPVEIQMEDDALSTTLETNKIVETSSKSEALNETVNDKNVGAKILSIVSKSSCEDQSGQIACPQVTSILASSVVAESNENREQTKNQDAHLEGSTAPCQEEDATKCENDKKLGAQISKNKKKKKKSENPQSKSTPTPEPLISVPPPDTDVPLDISIISASNLDLYDDKKDSLSDLPNLNVDSELLPGSKNVQGSDFVQSVKTEKTSMAKSLDIKTSTTKEIKATKDENAIKNECEAIPNHSTPKNEDLKTDQQAEKSNVEKKTKDDLREPIQDNVISKIQPTKKNMVADCSNAAPTPSCKDQQSDRVTEPTVAVASPTANVKNKPKVPPKPSHLKGSVNKVNNSDTIKKPSQPLSDEEEEYFEYKFTPRQVFISTICQTCKDPLTIDRHLCKMCQMVSYCSVEHLNSDETHHKPLCVAIQEIAKKRGGHVYNNSRILNHNDYRSLRVHTLNLCESFLRRSLQTFEREILLFPRLCSMPTCREWRQSLLKECNICHQATFCEAHVDHLPSTHHKWCKAYDLYQKLVITQKQNGRIEVDLPSKVMTKPYLLPNDINDVFKDLYKNLTYIQGECMYVTLTQLATAPLTAFFAAQMCNQLVKDAYTIHLVGAELQFEAEVLDKWETFFLHLAPNINELRIVFIGPELNAENLPLEILSRIRMCRLCRQSCRVAKFDFQCGKLYTDYVQSAAFVKPDLVCFFNAGLYRTTGFNGTDTWPASIKAAANLNCPILVTSYTELESPRDLERLQSEAGRVFEIVQPPQVNTFSSQRPERNFISDEIAPMIFKNYYVFIVK